MDYDIRELIDLLNKYTKAYDEGHPEISDKEWDDLYFSLVRREQETGIIYPDSPTQKISY
jgi:DNA ligase (NAD+)